MKQPSNLLVALILVSMAAVARVTAQPRFEIPLRVTDGQYADTLYFGILPGGHYCIDESDSMNGRGEFIIPAVPASGVFFTRFVWPRTGPTSACFDQGSPNDFRPFTNSTQKDTFRVWAQMGSGLNPRSTIGFSWPGGLSAYFTQLTLRYFNGSANVNVNMLTDTCVSPTDAGDPCVTNIYSIGLQPTFANEIVAGAPKEFVLYQNYPNPFNPTTVIQFRVDSREWVSLKVFDVLGREVATLVSERLTLGTHERTFNAEGLPSGVYFYRLHAGGFVQTRKLLLLR